MYDKWPPNGSVTKREIEEGNRAEAGEVAATWCGDDQQWMAVQEAQATGKMGWWRPEEEMGGGGGGEEGGQ